MGLAPLPGAVNGARQIAAWAAAAGYDVALVTDEATEGKPNPVTITRVEKALMRLLTGSEDEAEWDAAVVDPPERVIVYFAGHGLRTMSSSDVWLLSRSYKDQRAIGVVELQDMLKTYLPGKIAIISDACRDAAVQHDNLRLQALAVIPIGPYDPSTKDQIDIDRFLAVPEMSSAFMLRSGPNQPARCIFTSVLLEALRGTEQSAFDQDRTDEITSQSIARYLRRNVPLRGASYQVEMKPQSYPCWFDPDTYVTRAELAAMTLPPLDPWPDTAQAGSQGAADSGDIFKSVGGAEGVTRGHSAPPSPQRSSPGGLVGFWKNMFGGSTGAEMPSGGPGSIDPSPRGNADDPWAQPSDGYDPWLSDDERAQLDRERTALTEQIAALTAKQQRIEAALARGDRATHYESECGLTVAGAEPLEPRVTGTATVNPDGQFPGSWQIDFHTGTPIGRSTPLLAPMQGGQAVATLALGGYITDCIMEAEGCVAASFRRVWLATDIRLRSETLIASGAFAEATADDALDWVAGLRGAEPFDPMLGVLAAYLFHRSGQTCSVRRLAPLYAAQSLPLPFDIALLAGAPVVPADDGTMLCKLPAVSKRPPRTPEQKMLVAELGACAELDIPVAGAFPLMRQGWFLLGAARPGFVADGLAALAPELLPAPFATFEPDAVQTLVACLENSPWPS